MHAFQEISPLYICTLLSRAAEKKCLHKCLWCWSGNREGVSGAMSRGYRRRCEEWKFHCSRSAYMLWCWHIKSKLSDKFIRSHSLRPEFDPIFSAQGCLSQLWYVVAVQLALHYFLIIGTGQCTSCIHSHCCMEYCKGQFYTVHGWDWRSRQSGSATAPVSGRLSALHLHADERRSDCCRQVIVLSCWRRGVDDCKPIASECDQDLSTVAGLVVQCRQTHDPRTERPGLSRQNGWLRTWPRCRRWPSAHNADHIASVRRAAYYQLWHIRPMVRALLMDAAATVIQAFVSSRLDYCNSVLNGITENLFQRLQSVQNAAARLIMQTGRREHITPVLRQLHWLPVRRCMDFKLVNGHSRVQGSTRSCATIPLRRLSVGGGSRSTSVIGWCTDMFCTTDQDPVCWQEFCCGWSMGLDLDSTGSIALH